MYIKIYFEDKPVFLADEITAEIEEYRHHPDTVFIDEMSGKAIKTMLREINKREFHAGIIIHEDFKALKKAFIKHFTFIQTAGGLIYNETGDILMIFRRGKWDLPKGKIDQGETLKECAIREVIEETGLKKLDLKELLTVTYHTYSEFGKHIIKESHWYKMKTSADQKLIPQTEEDITAIEWVSKSSIAEKLENTFPLIREILFKANLIEGS